MRRQLISVAFVGARVVDIGCPDMQASIDSPSLVSLTSLAMAWSTYGGATSHGAQKHGVDLDNFLDSL